MEIITDCISPHVKEAREGHMQLVWRPPSKEQHRTRVVAWTCRCREISYELCRAAGQSFIRRSRHGEEERTIHETYRWPAHKADEVWKALLEGEVV
ncbi:hypothetical protein ABGB18_35550 [Nonomuraea sp. B12E4]|uniref:hypothetical protein n=1 Tax=Nonomuraea sp. B12E4 TaxID=3153564 RepID=UPI00325DD640